NIIKEYPIFGLGYDNYRTSLSDEYKVEEIKPKGFIHVHNTFLQFGAELGFFGLISFLFLLYSIFKKIIYFYLKCDDRNVKLFYLASLISIVIYIIQGLTQYNFGKTEPLSFFWIIIALNFIVYSLYENKSLGEF
ncbi:MAG: O-antigen ligase family protein, partial [Bacillota bacterium]